VQSYVPQAILAHLSTGELIPALCYNLTQPPPPTERNPEYAAKLRLVAQKMGLPDEYVSSIE
jgi:hypothetical protein